MGHPNARLTPADRHLFVHPIEQEGWPDAHTADSMSVPRATAYKWLKRWCVEGTADLEDRTSRPKHYPHHTRPCKVDQVLGLRQQKWEPHRIGAVLGMARSTVYAILLRENRNRLRDFDSLSKRRIRRYERARPGGLIHIDVKKQGKIPPGGG